MYSLVMSLFSRDYIKTEIDQLKYQQYFNLQEYSNHTVPGFYVDGRTSILVSVTVISLIESIGGG